MNDDIEDKVTEGLLPGEAQKQNVEGSDIAPAGQQNSYSIIGLQLGEAEEPVKKVEAKKPDLAPAENPSAWVNPMVTVYSSLSSLGLLSPYSAPKPQEQSEKDKQPAVMPKNHG